MIYRPLWNANRILVFNCLVLDFPTDQKDSTISVTLFIVLCVLTCIVHCSFLAAVLVIIHLYIFITVAIIQRNKYTMNK